MDSGGQSIFLLYSGVAILGIGVLSYHQWKMDNTVEFGRWFIPGVTVAVGLIGLFSGMNMMSPGSADETEGKGPRYLEDTQTKF